MTGPLRTTAEIEIEPPSVVADLLGAANETMRLVAKALEVELGVRGNVVRVVGSASDVALVERFLTEAAELLDGGIEMTPLDMVRGLEAMRDDATVRLRDLFDDVLSPLVGVSGQFSLGLINLRGRRLDEQGHAQSLRRFLALTMPRGIKPINQGMLGGGVEEWRWPGGAGAHRSGCAASRGKNRPALRQQSAHEN